MSSKLISAVAGVLLLAGSGLALADDGRGDRGRHDRNGWNERSYDRHDRGWDRPRGHAYGHNKHWHKHHRHHYHPRWHGPHHHYGSPGYHRNRGPHYGYDDGLTIIFKGRID